MQDRTGHAVNAYSEYFSVYEGLQNAASEGSRGSQIYNAASK